MKTPSAPYFLIQARIDVITKVPAWASEIFKKGDEVYRESADCVIFGTKKYRLSESYTKFSRYSTPYSR